MKLILIAAASLIAVNAAAQSEAPGSLETVVQAQEHPENIPAIYDRAAQAKPSAPAVVMRSGTAISAGAYGLSAPPKIEAAAVDIGADFRIAFEEAMSAMHSGDVRGILRWLSPASLATAGVDEKVAILRTLLRNQESGPDGRPPRLQEQRNQARWDAVVYILKTAKTEGEFDHMFYHLRPGELERVQYPQGEEIERLIEQFQNHVQPGDWESDLKYVDDIGEGSGFPGNHVEFLVDGRNFLPRFFEEVDHARTSVHLEVYQLEAFKSLKEYRAQEDKEIAAGASNDPNSEPFNYDDFKSGKLDVGWELAEKLIAKVKKGKASGKPFHAHIILDEDGSIDEAGDNKDNVRELIKYMQDNGVEAFVREAPHTKNHLDHRKLFVIDGKVAFVGGMNLGQSYQAKWHDQQTRIEGPVVNFLQHQFVAQWEKEEEALIDEDKSDGGELYPHLFQFPDGVEIRVLMHEGGETDQKIKASYLRAFKTAQKRIKISNPYVADSDIIAGMCKAKRRGVPTVQIILPLGNDEGLLKTAARSYYRDLLDCGVEIYEFIGNDPAHPEMAHQKVSIVDDWATFGSSNLDARSLAMNDEINLVILDRDFAEQVDRFLFQPDTKEPRSKRITHWNLTFSKALDYFLVRFLNMTLGL